MDEIGFFSFTVGADVDGVDVQTIIDLQKDGLELDHGFLFVVRLPAPETLQCFQSSVIQYYSHASGADLPCRIS